MDFRTSHVIVSWCLDSQANHCWPTVVQRHCDQLRLLRAPEAEPAKDRFDRAALQPVLCTPPTHYAGRGADAWNLFHPFVKAIDGAQDLKVDPFKNVWMDTFLKGSQPIRWVRFALVRPSPRQNESPQYERPITRCDRSILYAQEAARLPPLPVESWLQRLEARDAVEIETPPAVVKLVATDAIPGAVLPRACDAWFALAPFDDLRKNKNISADIARDLMRKRRAFVLLLAAHAASPTSPHRWNASTMQCGETAGPTASAFWIQLLRALCPASLRDVTHETTRHLVAMCDESSPRFLLSVTQDVAAVDVAGLMESFLYGDIGMDDETRAVFAACGVSATTSRTVEIGLSFTKGKITTAFLTALSNVLASQPTNDSSKTRLRVTTLRFGRECVMQGNAMEFLGQSWPCSTVKHLRLGNFAAAKPACVRACFRGLLDHQHGLQRLGISSPDGFVAVVSALRNRPSDLKELDVVFEPTLENAMWLAFGLFHVDSLAAVTTLRLRIPRVQSDDNEPETMDTAWLETFKRVLQSSTAAYDLADMEDESKMDVRGAPTRRFVKIQAGTAVKTYPHGGAKLLCKIDDTAEAFEAIAATDKAIAIIVAGLGVGWVAASSISSEEHVTSGLTDAPNVHHSITLLVVDCAAIPCSQRNVKQDVLVETVLGVLDIVGKPLASLHLPMTRLTTDQLARVLVACPNLIDLNVSGHRMSSIAPLVMAYASTQCKIETLSLVRGDTWCYGGVVTREITEILRSPGARTLRRLAVYVLVDGWRLMNDRVQTSDDTARMLLDAVAASEDLAFAKLPGPKTSSATPRSVPVSSSPLCRWPMALTAKLAFLSCVHHEDTTSAVRYLDASVISRIFRLSGEATARRALMNARFIVNQCPCCKWRKYIM